MSIANLEDVFIHELKDVLDAEKQLLRALPKMAKAATSEELQEAFEEHAAVTENQVGRLEQVFDVMGKSARGKKCVGMQGLIDEGKELMSEEEPSVALDAALICAAQKAEHYEIAAYGSLISYAKLLELPKAVKLLEATLAEEKQTDENLTAIASELNLMADEEEAEE